uniref:Uncharacterized protein n=1 Tax=Aegilops tauschii subsp. strangulata TaxID=200361 RepID=A0A453M564_AEGTS
SPAKPPPQPTPLFQSITLALLITLPQHRTTHHSSLLDRSTLIQHTFHRRTVARLLPAYVSSSIYTQEPSHITPRRHTQTTRSLSSSSRRRRRTHASEPHKIRSRSIGKLASS